MKRTWTYIAYCWDAAKKKYVLVEEESSWFWDDRPSAESKASQAEKNLAAKQAAFYDVMTQAYQTQFANQTAILDALKKAWEPILVAGPNQFGFNPAEETAYRSQATEGTAGEYAKAERAVQQSQAADGGGNAYLPSGVNEQVKAAIASGAASDEASKQLGITKAGYELGRTNFLNASNALGRVSEQMNPLGYSGSATNAGEAAFKSADTISKENGSWMGALGGMLGSVADIGLGEAGTALSKVGSGNFGW